MWGVTNLENLLVLRLLTHYHHHHPNPLSTSMTPQLPRSNKGKATGWTSRIRWLLGFLIILVGVLPVLEISQSIQLLTEESTTKTDLTRKLGPAASKADFHTPRLLVATNVSVSAASSIPTKKESSERNAIDLTTAWPLKPPKEVFPEFDDCHVVFRDPAMATCNVGAFGGNFGDLLGPDIVKRIVEYKFGCSAKTLPVLDFASTTVNTTTIWKDRPCLWSVGSVWRNVRANDHVWGTGSLGMPREFARTCKLATEPLNITVYSARGHKTIEVLEESYCATKVRLGFPNGTFWKGPIRKQFSEIPARGDPGFLIPYLFPEFGSYDAGKADLEQCMIFHYYDETLPFTKGKNFSLGEGKLPVVQPWPTMVGNITRCKRLLSSSLHGVIIADAFGIPVQWLRRQSAVQPYKFYDYFESFPHGHWNSSISGEVIGESLKNASRLPKPMDAAHRSEYARNILESFPFHLFRTAAATAAQVEKNMAHSKEDLVGELLDLISQSLRGDAAAKADPLVNSIAPIVSS